MVQMHFQRLVRWFRFNLLYFGQPPWDTGITPPELVEFIRLNPPGRAIDLGCGTGTNLLALAAAGWQVTGVDFAMRAVDAARRRLSQAGVDVDVRFGDVTRLENIIGPLEAGLDGLHRYDLALDIGCYHGLGETARAAYRRNLPQILAPMGTFLMYAVWQTADAPSSFGITPADFKDLCSILELADRRDSLDHRGRPAVWLRLRQKAG